MKARPVFISNLLKVDFLRMTVSLISVLSNVLAEISCILKSYYSISDKRPTVLPVPTWGKIRYKVR
jgi:hypothetical protein